MTTANGELFCKCGLFFTDTSVTAVQLGSVDEYAADDNYETWERVVESVNTKKTSMVDYSIKDIPFQNAAMGQSIKTTSYEDIKSVTIRKAIDTGKDPNYDQYDIIFSTGLLAAVVYVIPAASLDEAVGLLNKTPLASKIKRT